MTAEQRNMDPGAGARLGLEADGRDVNGRDGDENSRNGDMESQG